MNKATNTAATSANNVDESKATPAKSRKKNNKPTRPANQPSIGSFFSKVNASSTTKQVKKHDSFRNTKLKGSSPKVSTKDSPKGNAKLSQNKSVLKSIHKEDSSGSDSSPLSSSSQNTNKSNSQSSSTSSNKKATSKNKKASKPSKPSNNALPKKEAVKIIPQDDDILAIVLGTHKDTEDAKKKTNATITKRTTKRPIHLPALITSDSQFQKVKSMVCESSNKKGEKSGKSSSSSPSMRTKRDPNMPKAPKNAFILYSLAIRPTVTKNHPELKGNDVSKEIGRMYRELSPEDRKKYDDLAHTDKARYQQEMDEYKTKNPSSSSSNAIVVKDDNMVAAKDDINSPDEVSNNESDEGMKKEIEDLTHEEDCDDDKKLETSGIINDSEEKSEMDNDEENSHVDVAQNDSEKQRPHQSCAEEKGISGEEANDTSEATSKDNGSNQNNGDNKKMQKEENSEDDCDVTLGSHDDEFSGGENQDQNDNALDDNDMQIDLDDNEDPLASQEEKQLAEGVDDVGQHDECEEGSKISEPEDNIEYEDLFSDKDDDTVEYPTNCNKEPDEVSEITPSVVNVLQPRKKVRAAGIVHTLQPRKKVKVNEMQRCNNITVNELTPRKKEKVNRLQSRKEEKVNTLTPRKKVNVTSPVNAPERCSKECESFLPSPKVRELPFMQSSKIEQEVEIIKKNKDNELKPRQQLSKSKTSDIPKSPPVIESIKSPTKSTSPTKVQTQVKVSEDDRQNLEKYRSMRSLYVDRAQELVDRAMQGLIEEEDFQSAVEQDKLSNAVDECGSAAVTEFNDDWISQVATIIQGSALSLHELSMLVARKISETLGNGTKIALDTISAKIKLLASRTQYLSSIPVKNGIDTAAIAEKIDIFTDVNKINMWRWELVSIDLLPDDKKACVKKARAGRKKLKYHQKAIIKLIHSIDDFETAVSKGKPEVEKQKRVAKISADEEKVLKYERDEEKARLQRETKAQKEKERVQKQLEKEAEKDRKKEQLQKKQDERTRAEAEKHRKKEEKSKKQRAMMMSFFKSSSSKQKSADVQPSVNKESQMSIHESQQGNFDSEAFWNKIDCGTTDTEVFSKLSNKAKNSRRRKISRVDVRVFATVLPDNPFEQQPYDEERIISIRNRNKYLSFHEDYRPPYHGTWSKPTSTKVTGRSPFAQDTSYLNYEIDSEAEWEEGDDEQGDNCSVDDNDDDELEDEMHDTTKYDYQDGWIARDDDLALEDDDDEAKEMRKKKAELLNGSDERLNQLKPTAACVIAPLMGGVPQFEQNSECPMLVSDYVEGIEIEGARNMLFSHEVQIFEPVEICLDPFPPTKQAEMKSSESGSMQDGSTKKPSDEMSDEDLKTFAKFVHNCNLKSKELIIEEFRLNHGSIISSRAQLHRKLDLIATKRRLKNGGGVIWEVKNSILKSLDLKELMKEDAANEECDVKATKSPTKTTPKKPRKKSTKKPIATSIIASDDSAPALVSPLEKPISKKRKEPEVSKASANLLASFLKRKKS